MSMNKIKKNVLVIFTAFLLFYNNYDLLIAGNGGSGYSRYGIGDLYYSTSSRAVSMGGTEIGLLSPLSINYLNPAAWSEIIRTRYAINTMYEGFRTTDGNKSAYFSGMFFNGLTIAIPISPKNGITIAFGIHPYSRVNYNVITPSTFDTLNYNTQYIGDGGISLGQIGISGKIGDDFHLGVRLNYYNGTLNYSTKQMFEGSNYTTSEVTRTITANGVGMTAGFSYSGLRKLINLEEAKSLNVGIIFSTSSNLNTKEEKYYTYKLPSYTTRDTSISPNQDIQIPFTLGWGISYSSDRMLINSDFLYQNWKNFSFGDVKIAEYRNNYRLGIGYELMPKKDQSASYWQRTAYRLGIFYNSSYLRVNNEPINEIGFTGGIATPIFGDVRLNTGLEYIIRGTSKNQMQKDNIIRIIFTVSGSELWFERPEQE